MPRTPEELKYAREWHRQWYQTHKEVAAERNRRNTRKYRMAALGAYGGKCACCGESCYEFLGIDHIDGGGGKHRKELLKSGTHIYLWLKKNDYPDGYRVLCHNCNLAIGFYGACPHERIKT